MLQLPKIIKKTLSVRIGLMMVLAMTLLLMASMMVMLHYSRKAVKTEAIEKAVRSLEGMTNNIDNILLSVEQTTGNIYFNMLPYLNNPDMMTPCAFPLSRLTASSTCSASDAHFLYAVTSKHMSSTSSASTGRSCMMSSCEHAAS